MSTGVRLTGDWSKFETNLRKLSKMSFTGLHKNIGEYLVDSTKDRFRKGVGPDGQRWPKSIRAKTDGGQTLRDTNILMNSLTYRAYPNRVDMGTNVRYAPVHQQGQTIKVKRAKYLRFKIGDRYAMKKQVVIPARPFIGINQEDKDEIVNIINEAIEECLK